MSDTHTREWVEIPDGEVSDAVIAALERGGVEYLFFTSGSEIGFYQEAIAKAKAQGRNKVPRLITVTHEHASLNAALGYAAVSGKLAATAAHVDVGTQHYGGAVHTAWHSGLPVLITAGAPPTSHPGTIRGARDGGGHIWMQQSYDQHGIVRQYTKWDHRLECQDNPGLIVSRALQVAQTEPKGPVYISFPREVALMKCLDGRFPTADQLGIARPAAPDPDGINEIAKRLVRARNPIIVAGRSGRNPRTVPALVHLCELLGIPVVDGLPRAYLCFPMTHPLYLGSASLKDADVVLVLEADVPWMPGPAAPPENAYVAVVDVDAAKARIPTFEFTADLRLTADALTTIEVLAAAVRPLMTSGDRSRFVERGALWRDHTDKMRASRERVVKALADKNPIDPRFLASRDRPHARRRLHHLRRDHHPRSLVRPPALRPPGLLFLSAGERRRLVAGRRVRGEARRARARRGVDHRRRLLHVRGGECRAVVGGPLPGALHEHHLPEPQLLDRRAARRERVSRRLRGAGGI